MGGVPIKSLRHEEWLHQGVGYPLATKVESNSSQMQQLLNKDSSFVPFSPDRENIEVVKHLLDAQVNLGTVTHSANFSPLFIACHYGLADLLASLLAKEVDVSSPDSFGFTPLYIAAYKGHAEVVKLLLLAGAPVDKGKGQLTPLIVAAQNGHDDVVGMLLAYGAEIQTVLEPDFVTVYDIAATAASKELIVKAHQARGNELCAVCWENPVNAAFSFVPCGHNIVCRECNMRLVEKNIHNCPMCRSVIWCRASGNSRCSY